ncbi:hypothetical protein AX17_000298 [Amanita inopinata Kibby_2008]|nr:hypothetical protein AX17_000298 [Amanita inopinata Kibby_2008]
MEFTNNQNNDPFDDQNSIPNPAERRQDINTPLLSSANTQPSTVPIPITTIMTGGIAVSPYTLAFVPQKPTSTSLFVPTETAVHATLPNLVNLVSDIPSSKCAGSALDASADGLIATAVLSCTAAAVIWFVFIVLRPRLRYIYALREWFIPQDLRPKPLPSSFFAFLHPPVPMVPALPSDLSHARRPATGNACLFPSDEQLSQRFLWVAFLITLGWSIIGLGAALPTYLIHTPCISRVNSADGSRAHIPILLDLSILRLLRIFDSGRVSSQIIHDRNSEEGIQFGRVRLIITTVLALVVGLPPALWLVLREFNNLVEYRRQWTEVKCEGKEIGWLSATRAPGFVGWGERRIKQFIISTGISSSLDVAESSRSTRRRSSKRRRTEESPLNEFEKALLEVDVQMLFSIGDTQQLALLIDDRDVILENLEIAETKYTRSFRITTPDPSVLDFELSIPPSTSGRPYISTPRPLGTYRMRGQRRRAINRALASSSLAPTSFVAPSQYYKLRNIRGVSSGHLTDSSMSEKGTRRTYRLPEPSFSDAFNSRIIGSRFFEVNRNSIAYGHIPLGSPLAVDETGQLVPSTVLENASVDAIPNPRLYGPNFVAETASWDDRIAQQLNMKGKESYAGVSTDTEENPDGGWVDIARTAPVNFGADFYGTPEPEAGPSNATSMALLASASRRPTRYQQQTESASRRETFPRRQQEGFDSIPPPHLRLQPSQPFVRPLDGVGFDDLGEVYANITHWRSSLKTINAEIEETQRECYNDIADGARIKGWLMVGRGLRHIPGIKLIEGRAKEDVRWDVLQNERSYLDAAVLWAVIGAVTALLVAGLTAASGLSLTTAPGVAHFLPFLRPLLDSDMLASGMATVLAPAIAVTLFLAVAFAMVDWAANIYGCASISSTQLFVFKIAFLLSVVATIWLVVVGSLLFSLQAFSTGKGEVKSVADGSIYTSILLLAIITTFALVSPGLLLLQPVHVWRATRSVRQAITPRQRFRAIYPTTYNPSFALGGCIFALIIASTFWLVFPLIGPAVTILLLLTLIAHRYLVSYVYVRTHSQTGGLLQLWLLKRIGSVLSLQPALLGLIFLSRSIWIEGSILLGAALAIAVFVEAYTSWKTRDMRQSSLSAIAQDSIDKFTTAAKEVNRTYVDEQDMSEGYSGPGTRVRESMASVLDMMSITLAVVPSQFQGSVPLRTENLDDLTATERAARTHPDAPPHLPPLPFVEHADDMAGILYAPELIAPPPVIWLPNDPAGVARSEAVDLQKYHELHATLDVHEMGMPSRTLARS